MTSALMSSQSADGVKRKKLKRRRIENQQMKRKRRRREDPVASYSAISRCYWRLAIAKRCRLHKLIRQRFALAIKIQQEDFALLFQQTKLQCIQSQRKASSRKKIQAKLLDNQTQATAASSRETI
ncbi:hypothetical protein F511_11741 [Dorcoceras hygrometricum]|uniref:Uncharacterized protein n=1 Tax=Dorcoceras hygrometricum TaxID=472368 RepID=A0A2Z7BVL8_9LAMI|nr:hypothetical protein F511_11741 [Dorcoceras hygrometricum]